MAFSCRTLCAVNEQLNALSSPLYVLCVNTRLFDASAPVSSCRRAEEEGGLRPWRSLSTVGSRSGQTKPDARGRKKSGQGMGGQVWKDENTIRQ